MATAHGRTEAAPRAAAASVWDAVPANEQISQGRALWRLYGDDANRALLDRWLPARRVDRLLKTDLFDESCTEGLAPLLASRAQSVIGIDVSREILRRSRDGTARVQICCSDVRALPFPDESFDVVVSNSTLDHFASKDDIATSVRELARVLRTGGELILTLDNLWNPLVAVRNALFPTLWRRLGMVPYYVGASHGPRGLDRVLTTTGFEVLELTCVQHFPRIALVALQRSLPAGSSQNDSWLLRLARQSDRLDRLPTRFLTGQYLAAHARKRDRSRAST